MPKLRSSLRAMTGLAVGLPAMALATAVVAQDELPPLPAPTGYELETTEVRTVPSVPVAPSTRPLTWNEEVTVGPDGVETITRTRVITRSGPYPEHVGPHYGSRGYPGGPVGHAPIPMVSTMPAMPGSVSVAPIMLSRPKIRPTLMSSAILAKSPKRP